MTPKYSLHHVTKDHPFMTCLVKVNTRSSWQKTVTKVLNKCHGIYSFRMDDNGVVEISGTVDPNLLLKMLGKAGRKAELRWLQFGECSSNLFMPMNHSNIGGYGGPGNYGGTSYAQDGRYLHSGNLPRPKLPSEEAIMSSAHNTKNDYQIAYDHKHDYYQYAHDHNHHYQHSYDHKHDYQLAYDHKLDNPHSYDHRHDYQHYDHRHDNQHYRHDYRYDHSHRHDGNQTHYRPPLPTLGGEDMSCCTVM
ncbi:hypothetical protein Pfo_013511 [Paulownia fortunei]|nr:hypothetical protein Pfo_013511 [Paulownia fortunei]